MSAVRGDTAAPSRPSRAQLGSRPWSRQILIGDSYDLIPSVNASVNE